MGSLTDGKRVGQVRALRRPHLFLRVSSPPRWAVVFIAALQFKVFLTACRKTVIFVLPIDERRPNLVFLTAYRPLPFREPNFRYPRCRKP